MDAIELICTSDKINAICIVSSDGGFAGLAQRISEKGLHVMAAGKKDTPTAFRKACHNFFMLRTLAVKTTKLEKSGMMQNWIGCCSTHTGSWLETITVSNLVIWVLN